MIDFYKRCQDLTDEITSIVLNDKYIDETKAGEKIGAMFMDLIIDAGPDVEQEQFKTFFEKVIDDLEKIYDGEIFIGKEREQCWQDFSRAIEAIKNNHMYLYKPNDNIML